jgi:hypothetical protein
MKRTSLIAWAILRLPILGLIVYGIRFQIAEFIENSVGLDAVMDFAVYSASTFSTRILLYTGGAVILWLSFWLAGRRTKSHKAAYFLFLAAAFLVIYISFQFLLIVPNALLRSLFITIILAMNTVPYDWLAKRLTDNKFLSSFFIAGIGIAEALVPQSYFFWLSEKIQNKTNAAFRKNGRGWQVF